MRSISTLLQRGFDNTVANWPLILVGIAAQVAMIFLFLVLFLSVLIPGIILGVSVELADFQENPEAFLESLILGHPFFILYALVAIGVILIPVMMVYAFVEGAKYGLILDGEKARGEGGYREMMRTFEPSRWLEWGRRTWWRAFWVYNIIWVVAFIAFMAVALVFGAVMFAIVMAGGEAAAGGAVAVGCLAALILIPLAFAIAVVTNMYTQIAMSLLVRSDDGAVAIVSETSAFIRSHLGRSLGVTALTMVVGIAIGTVFGGFGFIFQLGGEFNESLLILMLPIQIMFTVVQTAVSIAVQTWMAAVFVSMVESESTAGRSDLREAVLET